MRSYPVFDTVSQNEALINEFKGNLFEYLVAAELARRLKLEASFMRSLAPQLAERLRHYEDWLWQHDQLLAQRLPELAQASCVQLLQELPAKNYVRIIVMGKLAGGSHDDSFGEADILLVDDNEVVVPISLKLCRSGAYVNTKSGGIRTFLNKYFKQIPEIELAQERVNLVLDESFAELAHILHERHGLTGQEYFGAAWKAAGLPLLPGELIPEDQQLLQEHYARVINVLYESLQKPFVTQRAQFDQALLTLLGFKLPGMIQLTCFHRGSGEERYQLDQIVIVHEQKRRQEIASAALLPPKNQQASFSLEFPWGLLQIRVKPMNKFTQAALKVNCSVREQV